MSAFIPAQQDVPTYFLPMLNDIDRNMAYEKAIQETLARFQQDYGRAATVLDVGAGTGMLTMFALQHGAAHVTAIEANTTLGKLAVKQIKACFPGRDQHWVLLNTLSVDFKNAGPFDIVVSELLGSMINSESMYVYLWDLMMRGIIANFGSDESPIFYVVPKRGCMTLCPYRCERACMARTGISYAHMNYLYEAVYNTKRNSAVHWVQDESMKICLAGDCSPLGDPIIVLQEHYNQRAEAISHPRHIAIQIEAADFSSTILVLEWIVHLTDDVMLCHTLDHVAKLPLPVMLARWAAWGHLFTPLNQVVRPTENGIYLFTVKYVPSDLHLEAVKQYSRKPGLHFVSQRDLAMYMAATNANHKSGVTSV